jgi:hypothetical protein
MKTTTYKILARDGFAGDFVNITIEALNVSSALAKLRRFGSLNGFFNLSAWTIEEVAQ